MDKTGVRQFRIGIEINAKPSHRVDNSIRSGALIETSADPVRGENVGAAHFAGPDHPRCKISCAVRKIASNMSSRSKPVDVFRWLG